MNKIMKLVVCTFMVSVSFGYCSLQETEMKIAVRPDGWLVKTIRSSLAADGYCLTQLKQNWYEDILLVRNCRDHTHFTTLSDLLQSTHDYVLYLPAREDSECAGESLTILLKLSKSPATVRNTLNRLRKPTTTLSLIPMNFVSAIPPNALLHEIETCLADDPRHELYSTGLAMPITLDCSLSGCILLQNGKTPATASFDESLFWCDTSTETSFKHGTFYNLAEVLSYYWRAIDLATACSPTWI
jgi:hypothetical protein